MSNKLHKDISDLISEDENFICFINPFTDKKANESNDRAIASFIEKKNKLNRISIKIKNKQIKKKLQSLVSINIEDHEQENEKGDNLKKKYYYLRMSSRNLGAFKFSSKKFELPSLVPLGLRKNKSNSKLNFLNDYENNFYFDIDYSFLKYNATEIFKNKSRYKKIIIDKIKNIKKGIFDKKTIKLEKKFYFGKKQKEIKLSLTTLTISLQDMSLPTEKQNDNLKLNLPISLLPLFYYKGIYTFQKLLSTIIKVENNLEKISFDEKQFELALNNIPDYNIDEENDDNLKNIKYEDLKSPILQRNNNFLNFNNFIFFWVTNTKRFATKVTLPCIHLEILDNNICLKDFIDYELLFYLFEKDFEYWEYYIVKYLSTFSKYRNIFEQMGKDDKYCNQTLFLKEPKTKINTFAQETLYNIYTDKNNTNQIALFKSFYIIVNLIDETLSLVKNYRIYFSFFQYIKLYEIAKYSNKIDFLSKFLEIDSETHTLQFNFKEYDEFDANIWMENLRKYSNDNVNNKDLDEELFYEFKVYNKKVKIEYKKPLWSIIKFENSKEVIKTWEIGKETEILLVNSIINPQSWNKFLNECLKKLDEPYEEIPVIPTVSRPHKRHTTRRFKI